MIRAYILICVGLIAFFPACNHVRMLHDEKRVAKDIALLIQEEKSRDRFEMRLKRYGFYIQSSSDRSDCEAQLCLDDHCRQIFIVTYKVNSAETIYAAETEIIELGKDLLSHTANQ